VVHSPLIEEGRADVILSFEILESLRWLNFLAPAGAVLANTQKIVPPIAAAGLTTYLDDPAAELAARVPGAVLVPADAIARELGNTRLVNSVMLGVLSTMSPLDVDAWRAVVAEFVPAKARDVNRTAFERGRALRAV